MTLPAYETKPVPPLLPITSYGEIIDPCAALRNCKVGKCFVVDTEKFRYRMSGYARRLGIKVKTKRNESGRYDVWRIE